jgi:hypothetical protein
VAIALATSTWSMSCGRGCSIAISRRSTSEKLSADRPPPVGPEGIGTGTGGIGCGTLAVRCRFGAGCAIRPAPAPPAFGMLSMDAAPGSGFAAAGCCCSSLGLTERSSTLEEANTGAVKARRSCGCPPPRSPGMVMSTLVDGRTGGQRAGGGGSGLGRGFQRAVSESVAGFK